ncbi:hypothetical protein AMTRI_Chr09g15960 [Amborella trichopoda]
MARNGAFLRSLYDGMKCSCKRRKFQSCNSIMDSLSTSQLFPRLLGVHVLSDHSVNDWLPQRFIGDTGNRTLFSPSYADSGYYKRGVLLSPICLLNHAPVKGVLCSRMDNIQIGLGDYSMYHSYSSFVGGKRDNHKKSDVPSASSSGEPNIDDNGIGSDWVDMAKNAYKSAMNAAVDMGRNTKETYDEVLPIIQQYIDSSPVLRNTIIPVVGTTVATAMAWMVMPRILRRLHKYSKQGPAAFLSGRLSRDEVSYEQSFWGALEDPVRYLVTFMAFSQLGVMIAPTTLSSHFIIQAWRGAFVLSVIWFLYRWKTNVFTRMLSSHVITGLDREKILALDRLSSMGLLVLGLMASAEACGVAVQSILTVGGIGGVATAFAARDILGNVLSGLSLQFSKPFTIGDTIKAGSIEGQVVDMGLTSTSLLTAEKYPLTVPNSLFSSQVIMNKSRAHSRTIVTKIPIRIHDIERIPQISQDIKCMLENNAKASLENGPPYCFLSRIGHSYAELTIGCTFRHMSKVELFSAEQDVLLQAAQIIRRHGGELGSSLYDGTNN